MKNNNLLKGALALALGVALVAPTTNVSYAEEATTTVATDSIISKYDQAVLNLEYVIKKSEEIKNSSKYTNATKDIKAEFDIVLKGAKATLNEYSGATTSHKDDLEKYTLELNSSKDLLQSKYDDLDGMPTNKDDLYDLTKESSVKAYKATDAYKNASEELQKAYDDAIIVGSTIFQRSDASNYEVVRAVQDIETAQADIEEALAKADALADLKVELDMYKNINKSDYTEKSYKTYKTQYELAHTIYESDRSYSSKNIITATNALKDARQSLIKATTPEDEKNAERLKRLKKAVEDNKTTIRAAELLIQLAPEKVKDVRTELDKLIKEAKERNEVAQKYIDQLEGKRG